MSKHIKSARHKSIVVIAVLVLLLLIGGSVLAANYLFKDPATEAYAKASDKLYDVVAYEASSLNATVSSGTNLEELKSRQIVGSKVTFNMPVLNQPNNIYWDAEASAQGDATVFLSHEVRKAHGCVRYSANTSKKKVEVTPMQCSRVSNDANTKEIILQKDKISAIRQAKHDITYCYSSYSPEFGGRNYTSSECH
jgi:hypothetical protein